MKLKNIYQKMKKWNMVYGIENLMLKT